MLLTFASCYTLCYTAARLYSYLQVSTSMD